MNWVAPAERHLATEAPGQRRCEAADHHRANGGLKAQEYSGGGPHELLGLIFPRLAEVRFVQRRSKLEFPSPLGTAERRGGGPGLQPVGPVPSPGASPVQAGGEDVPHVSRRGSHVDEPASSARGFDQGLRKQLIEARAVDVMVAFAGKICNN